ncbi:hypothetical protein JP75_05140 [Devosia riboflavina]|uniref:Lysine-specific metallo-endopeptidase domain-containing protein n=1 Tax=Devosia riboflavina TaxID=46914 RepID=A0A087M628_9HYPH|nr:hypothetical protein [Devosia riboflavina]KFL32331.1 hypothetical protein JP75_05140 [Devosia riboflavina]
MRSCLALLIFMLSALSPARADMADAAFDRAIAQFETARPHLPAELFGVDVAAYRAALTFRKFTSSHWGGSIIMRVENGSEANTSCARFAAFVSLPPSEGKVRLVLCPQFSTPGADALRTLTILHELVHVVAGPNECRAMAFAAHIEQAATGRFTDISNYWRANSCEGSGFSLP